MTEQVSVWQPTPFEGSDCLPIMAAKHFGPSEVPIVAEEDIEPEDIRLPQLILVQGTTRGAAREHPESKGGTFYFSASNRIIKPPIRMLVIHRFRGNAMWAREGEKEYAGLENCMSRDGVTGSRYGDCVACGRCTEWRANPEGGQDLPPLGSKTQQFVIWTADGVGIFRVALSNKFIVQTIRNVMTRRATTGRNWWTHPMVLTVTDERNAKGDPFYVPHLRWDETQVVPDALQVECYKWYERVREALEQGKLTDDESEQHGGAARAREAAPTATADEDAPTISDIPF